MKSGIIIRQRDIIIIPFPYGDILSVKKRPVVVISSSDYNKNNHNIICCAITSSKKNSQKSILVDNRDLEEGNLKNKSFIEQNILFTIFRNRALKKIGRLNIKKLKEIIDKININIEIEDKIKSKIPYSDFAKLDLKVGKILSVEPHPNADKLYVLKVDLAESQPRQIVAGLKPYYTESEIQGKKAVFITNLEPATIRGIESNGMILAADNNNEKVIFIAPKEDIEIGSKIR